MIELLLNYGASVWDGGRGSDRDWSPLKLALYHGAEEKVLNLLVPKQMTRVNERGQQEAWDSEFHHSRRVSQDLKRILRYLSICVYTLPDRLTRSHFIIR